MEIKKTVCRNPWCKATFFYTEDEMTVVKSDSRSNKINSVIDEEEKIPPKECRKCRSFNNELSGGVTWEDREYEGNPWSGPQQIKYKISKYK